MDEMQNFWVIGGDMRQAKLAELLVEDGHTVHTYALDEADPLPGTLPQTNLDHLHRAHCVVLPLPTLATDTTLNAPFSTKAVPIAPLFAAMAPGQVVCAGKISPLVSGLADAHNVKLVDYFDREELVVANGVPTAEGAVEIAMGELPITLHSARILVLGFGRVAKLTAHRFAALGAKVTVAARKWADLSWAQAYGYDTTHLSDLPGFLCGYDLVVNTIPATVLTAPLLQDLRPHCLIIDLASKPGGVDMEAAKGLGVRVIWALSLPGRVAPVTAGAIIRDTIYHILEEREV